jgi:hypothetical protein
MPATSAGMTAKITLMSRKTAGFTAGEIGCVRLVEDFLPEPADLVPREDNVSDRRGREIRRAG